ncbi:MAG: TatD family hydrolase [Clostridiales bacterium]|jgi:TatD DNase family protein|nr:TatD family hydrolase [Clostridiales bacterium]
MVELIDTHAHLNDGRFGKDLSEVIGRAAQAGVSTIINVGFDLESSLAAVDLAQKYTSVFAAVGVHPHDAGRVGLGWKDKVRSMAAEKKVVAIGEIGLDYYYNHSSAQAQETVFREQIRLAKELGLPVIIHDRDAHEEVLNILLDEQAWEAGGVFHCFSGNISFVRKCLDLGFYISLAGPVTFKNAADLQAVATEIPTERLLIETDSPYLAPVPYRGKRNEPAYVTAIADYVSKLRGESIKDFAEKTSENARRLFSLT